LKLQMPANSRAPGLVRAELKRWLAARAWPDEDGEDLEFAVSEAVSNAAEHAYRPDRTSAVRRQIRAHPIASSQLSVLQPLRKCEIL
jgi:anti-sigma regulatory factor (Ser/Thr protein kinase)